MSNGLSKEEQISNGLLTKRKGDSCEFDAHSHFRKLGWLIYPKTSGPIDFVMINEKTGKVRFVDVKYKSTRQGTEILRKRINRTITSPLKKYIKIEIVYVDDEGKIEEAYGKGLKEWNKEFEIGRNKNGRYNGEIFKK